MENLLVGTWRLVSYHCQTEDGAISYPLGADASGYIMYGADGYMSVSMSAAYRPEYASQDLKGGTEAERAEAAGTYITYCGPYELHADRVVHHIEHALFPNRVGTAQVRYYQLAGNRITLATPPLLIDGQLQTCHIVWERASSSHGS